MINSSYKISTLKDVIEIKYKISIYTEIIIETKKLKYSGTLRHAFKYALYALKKGGKLIIKDEAFKDFSFSSNKIDFWQVKLEFFRSVGDSLKLVKIDNSVGLIEAISNYYIPESTGISFGIVFSGAETEVPFLNNAIESILGNTNSDKVKFEIIVCGPASCRPAVSFDNDNIKYLPYDLDENAGRIMIGKKKNYIFENANYSVVSISHTRILFPRNFISQFIKIPFDFITPKVVVLYKNSEQPYLDYILIDSYDDLLRMKSVKVLSSTWYEKNNEYFNWLLKRVPTIDGGINVFNKNVIAKGPYNNNIAWGEAEDVVLSSQLFGNGYLIDYADDVKCISQTNKIPEKRNKIENKIKSMLFNFYKSVIFKNYYYRKYLK